MRRLSVLLTIVTLVLGLAFARVAFAMGTEELGNKPLSELNYRQWKGIVPIVNDSARVYQVWVNGNENLYYRGATKQLNVALAEFATVDVKNHVVVLRPGPVEQLSFDKKPIAYNWELHVIGGIAKSRATDAIPTLVTSNRSQGHLSALTAWDSTQTDIDLFEKDIESSEANGGRLWTLKLEAKPLGTVRRSKLLREYWVTVPLK